MRLARIAPQVKQLAKTIVLLSFITFITTLVATVTVQYVMPLLIAGATSFIAFVTPLVRRHGSLIAAAACLILGLWGLIGTFAYAFDMPLKASYYATVSGWGIGTAFILLPFIIGLVANLVSQEAPMQENMGEGFLGGAVLLVLAWLFAPQSVGAFITTFGQTFMTSLGIDFGALNPYVMPVFGIFMIFLLQGLMALLGAAVAEWLSPG